MASAIAVLDRGTPIEFSFGDLMRYHGPGSPGGVAHAFKVMERAFALLDTDGPPERREITIETAFGGPGARDAFECVTRAVTEDRYVVDHGLARPERGRTLERFVFRLRYRGRSVTLLVREGFVTDEFVDLARRDDRGAEDEARLDVLKREMAERVMAARAEDVYTLPSDMTDAASDRLDELSSEELYRLALDHAKRHLDVGFFWNLLKLLPAAEAAAGELEDAEADVQRLSAHLDDLTDAGRGQVADNLRPFYLEYLREHGVQAP